MLVKFSSDKPLLPWWRKFAIFNTKSAITYLVHEVRPRCLHAVGGFQDRPIKWWLSNFAQTTPVARPYLGHQAWSWTTLRRGNVFITFTNDFYFCQGFTFLTFFLFLFERFFTSVSLSTPRCAWGSVSRGSVRDSWYTGWVTKSKRLYCDSYFKG